MTASTPKSTTATPKTSTRSTTAANTKTTKPKLAAKPTAKSTPTAPTPKVVSMSAPVVSEPDMRKKELIDLAVARSGIKKKDAKPTVEAVLAILGEAIAEGRELNLQPFGKLRINRAEEKSNGRVIVCKLRQSNAAKKPKEPASETAK